MPPLTTAMPAIPARSATNMHASLQLRVLNPPHHPLPMQADSPRPTRVVLSEVANHPTGRMKYVQSLVDQGTEVIPATRQVLLPQAVLPPNPVGEGVLRRLAQQFVALPENRWIGEVIQPLEFGDWVKRYPENRRRQLAQARNEVLNFAEVTAKDAETKNFLKYEVTTSMTDPRNISPRSDRFLSIIGPYISALDKAAHHCKYLVKGIDSVERARKLNHFQGYDTFIETDYSRFDMTISYDWLRLVEYTILTSCFPQAEHPLYHQALRHTWRTRGSNEFEIRYQTTGGRCSGDAHTSLGNGLINRFNTWLVLQNLPRDTWESIHEGDDGVIAVSKDVAHMVPPLLTIISSYGFKVKTVVSHEIENVVFCGRWLVPVNGELREMCDVLRTLGKFHISLSAGKLSTLLLAKAMSYAYTDADTPIIGELCHSLICYLRPLASRSALKKAQQLASAERYLLRDVVVTTPTRSPQVPMELRSVLESRTGITVADQLIFERDLRKIPTSGIPATFTTTWAQAMFLEAPDRRVIALPEYLSHMMSCAS